MAKDVKGFLKIQRSGCIYRPIEERIKDFEEVFVLRPDEKTVEQAMRCMDCGTPFCHWACPVGNYIPEWNESVAMEKWERAYELLSFTNNLPEITGRVCPALCEYGCVLGINSDPVTVRENELSIVERAFANGLVKPRPPEKRTGKTVAVVGSGPAGLACADQLNKAGHKVVVFERDDCIGGLMRYGIPDFKLKKSILDRRIEIWKREGIEFQTNVWIGRDYPTERLLKEFDAVCLAGGARNPRDLSIPGRDLKGIHLALEYLTQSNRRVAGDEIEGELIDARDKVVVVIGGGDTGADCVGTANRQGAVKVYQIEVLPQPPKERPPDQPWPIYPRLFKTSTSHEEGCERIWSVLTKEFIGRNGRVIGVRCVRVEWDKDETGRWKMKEIPNSEFELRADLVLIAIGFLGPEHKGMLDELGVGYDNRGNVKTDWRFMTSIKGVFSAGDMHRGQSLVVWAISEGRKCAHFIDEYLIGKSYLPCF